MVAAALIPPNSIILNEDDMLKSQVKHKIEFKFRKDEQ